MSEIHTTQPSIAELEAQIAALKGGALARQADHTRPLLEHLLTTNTVEASSAKGSCWVGFKADTVEITVADGRKYKVSVIVTDSEAVTAREEEKKILAEAQKLEEKRGPLLAKMAELEKALAGTSSAA
jgi:hypothetical protein